MDLLKLDAKLQKYHEQYEAWHTPIYQVSKEARAKLGQNGYTAEDYNRELEATYQRQKAIFNPRLAIRPLLNEVLVVYEVVSAEEREVIRNIFAKYYSASGMLMSYILECAECLELPEDDDVFRLAMIAASIENYSSDFRDTDGVLAELAMAAVKAGIDIEPHCTAISELCSPTWGKGGGFMKARLAIFHIYAPKAQRVWD